MLDKWAVHLGNDSLSPNWIVILSSNKSHFALNRNSKLYNASLCFHPPQLPSP